MIDHTERIRGPYGTVEFVEMPSKDDPKLTKLARAALDVARGTWLITSPGWHPLWSQYVLSIVSLEDHPDFPPPVIKFHGATHELLLLAINPDHQLTVEKVQNFCKTGNLPYLSPINISEQFECIDEEIQQIAWLAARAVVNGHLNPEVADAPTRIREDWLTACTKGLAHMRGEDHAP